VRELWSAPDKDSFKVNFDIASGELFSVQAAICRDSHGTIVQSIYQFNPKCDLDYAEAQAVLLAASLAGSLKIVKFVLEGNYPLVISMLQQLSYGVDNHVTNLISKVFSLIPPSSLWEDRKVNTHYMGHWATARVISGCIPTFFSPSPPSIPHCSGKDPPPPSSS
jgi:hypothetical protein